MAGPWDDYQSTANTAKPWEDYATPVDAPKLAATPVGIRGDGFNAAMNYNGTDATAGAVRGIGSIGATLLRPFESAQSNAQRRTGMDGGLTELMGSNPESTPYQTTKLAAEALGTAPLGGMIANGLAKVPWLGAQIPHFIDAVRTGGMSVDGAKGLFGAATRVAGGAVNGAVTAGAIDPKDAGTGAMIGGAFPMAVQASIKAGGLVGKPFASSINTNPVKLQTAKESMDAGYVIPPSMLDPSFKNMVLESTSGKQATAQVASTRNQAVSEGFARSALGLPADAPLTFNTMQAYRKAQIDAGYEPLRQVGNIQAGPTFNKAMDDIANQYKGNGTIPAIANSKQEITDLVNSHKSNGFDTGDAIDAIRTLREDASALFRSTSAGDRAKAKATKSIADAYEGAIDDALATTGQGDLLNAYRDARKNIAKSGTVEKAIREGSGTLDARIIARELQKNKPLEGDLLKVAKFANTFDKAAQPPHLIGSPAVHNLTSMFSTGAGASGAAAGAFVGGPAGAAVGAAAGAAYPYIIPPLIRARMFSKAGQQGLLGGGGKGLLGNSIDEVLPLMYRTNPALLSGLIGQ